jgi:hypothetical protein
MRVDLETGLWLMLLWKMSDSLRDFKDTCVLTSTFKSVVNYFPVLDFQISCLRICYLFIRHLITIVTYLFFLLLFFYKKIEIIYSFWIKITAFCFWGLRLLLFFFEEIKSNSSSFKMRASFHFWMVKFTKYIF